MGAGVATSPHLSPVQRVAGEGGRLPRAGRTPSKQAPWGFGVPAEVLRPRSVPYGHLSGEPAGYPFAKPSPEGSGSAGPSKKVGSACASRFFFDCPTIASVACLPKETARFRGGPHFGTSLPCGKSAPHREMPIWRPFPIRESGFWAMVPVDSGDIEDKSGYWATWRTNRTSTAVWPLSRWPSAGVVRITSSDSAPPSGRCRRSPPAVMCKPSMSSDSGGIAR
jgi:hypothetical protein